jgi:hypothetical protein
MDFDDFLAQEALARGEADSRVKEAQILGVGDYFLREAHGIRIYGEILDAAALLLNGREEADLDEDELAEYKDTQESYKEPGLRFYRFTRCFSHMCPRGEMSDIHLSTVTRKLTQEEFLAAKKAGWL